MLALLAAILQIAGLILGYLKDKQQIDAGRAMQIKENLDASLGLLGKANKARADAVDDFDKHGVHNDDPNLRD